VLRDVVTLLVQATVLVLAGLAFGLRAPVGGVLISLGFVAVVAVSLSAISYTVGLLLKSEDALASLINMIVVPLMLPSGIMLPMTLGPRWLRDVARGTPFGYIINAMRDAFAGHYFSNIVAEGSRSRWAWRSQAPGWPGAPSCARSVMGAGRGGSGNAAALQDLLDIAEIVVGRHRGG
jgi:ABC-type uncharacterized transport system permease subunit